MFRSLCAVMALLVSVGCGGGGRTSSGGSAVGTLAVTWMSSGVWVSHVGNPGIIGDSDEGTFEIEFDAMATGADVWLNGAEPDLSGLGDALGLALEFSEKGDAVLLGATFTSPSGALMVGVPGVDARFLVRNGETERFVVTAVVRALADGFVVVRIVDIVYGDVTGESDVSYASDLEQLFTPDIFLGSFGYVDPYSGSFGYDLPTTVGGKG